MMQKVQNKNTSGIVYHYTNIDALYGMLRDGKEIQMWASDFRFLNDKEELINGLECLIDIFIKSNIDEESKKFLETYRNEKKYEKEIMDFDNYAIISFSKKKDALTQWRAYANLSDGICLGFLLEENKEKEDSVLSSVIYRKSEKRTFLNEKLEKNQIRENILKDCMLVKNQAFISEGEMRFIYKVKKYERFRVRNGKIIPYKIINFNKNTLKEVWIAPNCIDKELQKMSLKMFLESCGYEAISDDTKNNNLGNKKPQVKISDDTKNNNLENKKPQVKIKVSKIPLRES